jgi:hypothetical protein
MSAGPRVRVGPGNKRNGEKEHHQREPVPGGKSPSQLIDERITELNDWRGETLARVRSLVGQADPEVTET